MSSSENENDQRRRQREAPDANINNKKRSSSSSIISINLPNETSNADNEQIRQQRQQQKQKDGAANASTTSLDDSLSAPTSSTTRKGSAFPMRHPANVKLHSNDFQFSDYAKKLVEQSKNGVEEKANDDQEQQKEENNSSSSVDAATSSNTCADSSTATSKKEVTASEAAAAAAATIKPKKEVIELHGDAAHSHLQKQGQAWEMHYRHSQNHFFPVKNYLAQAFRSVVLPLFPPIENPEGCNEFDDATKNNGEENDENKEQQQQEQEGETTTVIAMKNDDDDDKNEKEDSKNTKQEQHQIEPKFIIECGCGTGSSLLPLMSAADFHHYAGFDISETAVELFKNHEITKNMIERKKMMIEKNKEEEQSKDKNNSINPLSTALPELFVLDAAEQDIPHDKIPKNSADVCLLIFVLNLRIGFSASLFHAFLVRFFG